MTANTFHDQNYEQNGCGLYKVRVYSLMSVFNMIDENNKNFRCLLIRNPWGIEPFYNTSFNSSNSRWTNSLVA
jgi:hypothetical protein